MTKTVVDSLLKQIKKENPDADEKKILKQLRTVRKLDIQGTYTKISKNTLKNRTYQEVFETEDTKAFLQTPEDLILSKLYYAGGQTYRNQDFEDHFIEDTHLLPDL